MIFCVFSRSDFLLDNLILIYWIKIDHVLLYMIMIDSCGSVHYIKVFLFSSKLLSLSSLCIRLIHFSSKFKYIVFFWIISLNSQKSCLQRIETLVFYYIKVFLFYPKCFLSAICIYLINFSSKFKCIVFFWIIHFKSDFTVSTFYYIKVFLSYPNCYFIRNFYRPHKCFKQI